MGNGKESPQFFNSFLFPKIFQAFRIAIQPSKLMIAFTALAVICLTGWIMDFSKPVVVSPKTQSQSITLARSFAQRAPITEPEVQSGVNELQVYINSPEKVKSHIKAYKKSGEHRGVFSTLWKFGSEKFHGALISLSALDMPGVVKNVSEGFRALMWALKYHYIYSIIFFAVTLAVISVAGGGICRIAALQFARDERPGMTEALRFSTKRFASLFTVPLAPVGIIICIGLFIFLLGLIGNIPRAGELIMGICLSPALIAGALIAVILIGTVAGFNLMFPAIAYDGSDCFDAISRSFSYVYSKPWRMGFYTAVAVIYGAICYMFVRFFTFLLLWVTRWFLQLGVWINNTSNQINKLAAIWPEPSFMGLRGSPSLTAVNWSESFAAFLVYLVLLAVVGLLVSFVISFYFSSSTIIYALMRNRVDNTALEDIYTPAAESKAETVAAEFEVEKQDESET
jgi:hypothetical protein